MKQRYEIFNLSKRLLFQRRWWREKRIIQDDNIHALFRTHEWDIVKLFTCKKYKLSFEIKVDFRVAFEINLDFKLCKNCILKSRLTCGQFWNQPWNKGWLHEMSLNQGCPKSVLELFLESNFFTFNLIYLSCKRVDCFRSESENICIQNWEKLPTWITERPKVNFCGRYVSFDQHQAINNNVIIELVGTRTWAYENIVKNRLSHK